MARNGNMPATPYTNEKLRVLSTKASAEMVRQVRELATARDCTVSVIVKTAIEHFLASNY
jgi:predicted transcriptional regulator